jgi:hypothetical protein
MVPEMPQIDGDSPGSYPTADPAPGSSGEGTAVFTWSWPSPAPIVQISLSAARTTGPTNSVTVEWQDPTGQWHRAAGAPGAVGAEETTRYLIASFSQPALATAVRVTVAGRGRAEVHELHVL